NLFEFKTKIPLLQKLPDLYSILIGKISFVGSQVVSYEYPDPCMIIKPGITGLSQLKYDTRDEIETNFEHYYIQNQNLIFDLEILLKSILRI
ncbi:MAG: sugar transferase, partial [Fidelibacterota bacterium]